MKVKFSINELKSPIIAVALHDGHEIDASLMAHLKLKPHERFREEDPYTAEIAALAVSTVIVGTSRFQVDLNRRKAQAIYRQPADAWGLDVWGTALSDSNVAEMLAGYENFYSVFSGLLESTIKRHGYFVVLDIHSYNHRRLSPMEEAPQEENPEVNIGTAHNRDKWGKLTERYIRFLSRTPVMGRFPDVRENVKFGGGGFSEWINTHYGEYGCVISVEFKKTFMDEWTGRVDVRHLHALNVLMDAGLPVLLTELDAYKKGGEVS